MPFNIEPPCKIGYKTIITWQFPGQTEKINDQGDDYEISLSFADCPWDIDLRIAFNINLLGVQLPYDQGFYDIYQEPNYGSMFSQRVVEIPDIDHLITPIYNTVGNVTAFKKDYLGKQGKVGNIVVQKTARDVVPGNAFRFDLPTLRNIRLIPLNEYYFNRCKKYAINIYKDEEKIFTDIGSNVPTVTWECEELKECPENTCPVDCKGYICCYNNGGISVHKYPKILF